jgi:DNA-binding NtrC family response regulator
VLARLASVIRKNSLAKRRSDKKARLPIENRPPFFTGRSSHVLTHQIESLSRLIHSIFFELSELKRIDEAFNRECVDLKDEIRRFEAGLIRSALLRTGGSQVRAAQLLNVKTSTLCIKIQRLELFTTDLSQNSSCGPGGSD